MSGGQGSSMEGKKVIVGVGGGIAAFKAVELVRELMRRRAQVRVVMTGNAGRFVAATTFSAITGSKTVVDLWDPSHPGEIHVELGHWADAIVVAPATANVMARAAIGMCDDALLATLSCIAGPRLFAPAMHERMWQSAPCKRAVDRLCQDGSVLVGPVQGALASGQHGWGRMAEPSEIADAVAHALGGRHDYGGRCIVISAGPTQEDLDPVRFISNRSSGRMGFALARAARDRGARVVLVAGPTSVPAPAGVELVAVRSARQMQKAVDDVYDRADVIVMTAAVADYRPADVAERKIKKTGEHMTIELVKNPDILAELGQRRSGRRPVLVGFAMETGEVAGYARKKLKAKKADLVVGNEAAVGFGGEDTQAVLVDAQGDEELPRMSKLELAHRILDRVQRIL